MSNTNQVNRQYKDSLFKFIFGNEEYKENALSLYNAINGSNYDNTDNLQFTTLDSVIFLGMKNDLSFLIDSTMNLYEHQSTFNPNMPLRGLMYFGKLYDSYVSQKDLNVYGSKQLQLPTPQFIIFYNGEAPLPTDELRFTSSLDFPEKSHLEVKAKIININRKAGDAILSRCKPLNDYSKFIDEVSDNVYNGMTRDAAVSKAVDDCIDKGVLSDILLKNKSEVKDMILTEYTEEKVNELFFKDGVEVGIEKGAAEANAHAAKVLAEKLNVSYDDAMSMLTEE